MKYHVAGSECYIDASSPAAQGLPSNPSNGLPSVTVFDFHGPLIFINAERFKRCFNEAILKQIRDNFRVRNLSISGRDAKMGTSMTSLANRTVVFDLTRVAYVDSKAVEFLLEMDGELAELNTNFVLAGPSEQILDCFLRCQMFEKFDSKKCFLTVHDAVCAAVGMENTI